METLRRFRVLAVRLSLLVTAIAALAGGLAVDLMVAKAILMGGIAGTLVFWVTALKVERLAILPAGKVKSSAYRWSFLRLAVYVVVLIRGYMMDPEGLRGLLGAAGGILIIRVVLVFLGLTGLDLKQDESEADGANR